MAAIAPVIPDSQLANGKGTGQPVPAPKDSQTIKPSGEVFAAHGKGDPAADQRSKDDDEPLATDGEDNIHAILRSLRRDEVASLSQNKSFLRTINSVDNYMSLITLETRRYIQFCFSTTWYIMGTAIFGGLNFFDLFSITFFGIGGMIFLGLVLIFCLSLHFPMLVRIYYRWADKYGGGLGLVNSGNPNFFQAMTMAQADAAKEALSRDYKETGNTEHERFFDYDISKMLLQLASVVYEHENDAIRKAIKITADKPPSSYAPTFSASSPELITSLQAATHKAGKLVEDLWGKGTGQKVEEALDSESDQKIREFCKAFKIEFEPISELNNTASAFSALFWDETSNWIVVSFKGTAPIEFSEWLSDFNTKLVSVGSHIPGFFKVHMGFKERVFPSDISDIGSQTPYDTITAGIKALSKYLRKKNGSENINVYFTGHSLGCATASLLYSKVLMQEEDIGKKTRLRDAYLFAAPIVCDRKSVGVFNSKMIENKKKIKTMWRITSNGDAVATLLPELGDYTSIAVSDNNAFAFAHLGTEIKMRDHPYPSHVCGNHISHGARIQVRSKFSWEEISEQRAKALSKPGELRRVVIGVLLQKIPLIGRVIAHCTIFYWDQLDRLALGQCQWTAN